MNFDEPASEIIHLDAPEDRYERLRLIPWWDQRALADARVLVVGAGALGNEIVKNLALLGVGHLLIVDFDEIEDSNLSRSVLYRKSDRGRCKAEVAAQAAQSINPDCQPRWMNADVTTQVGAGFFRWADVVIAGLDNRDARFAVNRACWKVNRPWVDGATEAFQGIARVFVPPDGPCYECTLSEQDTRFMTIRNSCGFIERQAAHAGRTPTTPATAAVIAGVEVQEAVKLLHPGAGLPGLAGRGFFFDGLTYDCFTVGYVRRDDCISHETLDVVIETELDRQTATISDVLDAAQHEMGMTGRIEPPSEIVTSLECRACEERVGFYRLLDTVTPDEAACPKCGTLRLPDVVTECVGEASLSHLTLQDMGFAPAEIVTVRFSETSVGVEISGDLKQVFGIV